MGSLLSEDVLDSMALCYWAWNIGALSAEWKKQMVSIMFTLVAMVPHCGVCPVGSTWSNPGGGCVQANVLRCVARVQHQVRSFQHWPRLNKRLPIPLGHEFGEPRLREFKTMGWCHRLWLTWQVTEPCGWLQARSYLQRVFVSGHFLLEVSVSPTFWATTGHWRWKL